LVFLDKMLYNLYSIKYTYCNYITEWFLENTELSSHHHLWFFNISVTPQGFTMLISSQPLLPSQPREALKLFSVDLPFLDISYHWNQTACTILCLSSFT
jgi:hypothetical protein